jgi:hypothetical protein
VVNTGEIDAVDNYDSSPLPPYVYGAYTQNAGSQTLPIITNVNSGNTLQVTGLVDIKGGAVNVDGNGSSVIAKYGFNQEGGVVDLNVGTINVTGVYAESAGLTTLEGGTLIAYAPGYAVQVTGGGVLSGYGAIMAGTLNASEIDVLGGKLAVTGAYTQTGGSTNVNAGVTLSVTGAVDEQAGVFNFINGALHGNAGYIIETNAVLEGSGVLVADVTNNGTITCGDATSYGNFSCVYDPMYGIQGNYSQSGTLNMKLGSTNAHDSMSVSGLASLGGTFNLILINGFVPTPGDTYFFFQGRSSGGFACSLPPEPNGRFIPVYNQYGMAFYVYFQHNGYY